MSSDLEITGERLHPEIFGETRQEHIHRYAWCRPFVRGLDVLDVASGEGYGSTMLATNARTVVGVDISDSAVRHSSARYKSSNLRFIVGSITNLPIEDKSVDAVVCFETIEHLSEQSLALREIYRVLREDGFLIVSTPNVDVYSHKQDHYNPFHVRELPRQDFIHLISQHFPIYKTYNQRLSVASSLLPEGGADLGSTECLIDDGTLVVQGKEIPDPMYFVVIAAKHTGAIPKFTPSVLFSAAYDVYWDSRQRIHQANSELLDLGARAKKFASLLSERQLEEMLIPSGFFEPDYYKQVAGIETANNEQLVADYFERGEALGLSPSPLFDTSHYRKANPDVVASGMSLLRHYLIFGQWEGRSPLPTEPQTSHQ